jgi:hypothetical protein
MSRPLVVEGEARRHADLHQSPSNRGSCPPPGRPAGLCRAAGSSGERDQVQQVHQEQLLMLLVVIQAEGEQIAVPGVRIALPQPGHHPPVNLAAIGEHVIQRRPGHQAALTSLDPGAKGFVIAVEQGLEARIDRAISGLLAEDHGLEEPAGVGQMPFARAAVRHRLGREILGAQSIREHGHGGTDDLIGDTVVGRAVGDPRRCAHDSPSRPRPIAIRREWSRFVLSRWDMATVQ